MKRGTLILTGAALSLVLAAAAFGFSIVGERRPVAASAQTLDRLATAEPSLDDACSSATTYERLKTKLFDVALDVGDVDPAKLDLLAGSTVVRMEDPILKAKDEELGVTVCAGRFVVELPPGAEKAFDGKRRLEAEIEYAAQVAADGSGIVYQLRGAEPITYRLAAFDLHGLPPLAPVEAMPALAQVEPILMAPEPTPVAMVTAPAAPKTMPDLPVVAGKATDPVKVERKTSVKPKPVASPEKIKPAAIKTVVAARKAEKPDSRALAKVAAAKPKATKTAAKGTVAKPKATKTAGQVAVAKPKPTVKPKPIIRSAAVVAKTEKPSANKTPKPVVKVAKLVTPTRAAPVRKAAVQPVRAASRNLACGPTRPLSERLMCANPALATKERRMMGIYYSALDNVDGSTRRLLQDTAGDFQAYRNNCRTETCLAAAFDDRTAEIRDILSNRR